MKRLLSLLTVMLMLVTVFALSVTAHADFTDSSLSLAETSYTSVKIGKNEMFFLESVAPATKTTFSVGDTVEVLVSIDGTVDVGAAGLLFTYDPSVLQLAIFDDSIKDDKNTADVNEAFEHFKTTSLWVLEGDIASITDGAAAFTVDGTATVENDIAVLKFNVIGLPTNGSTIVTCGVKLLDENSAVLYDNTATAIHDSIVINIACTNHSYIPEVDAQYLVSEANCQSPAIYKKSCEHCGAASATETFENGTKLDHTYTNGWVTDGDDTHTRKCDNFAVCGYSETLAHNWDGGSVTDEPSCFEKGTKTYTCTDNCGATKEEDIDPTGNHTYGEWVKVDDSTHSHTCTTPGCGASEPGNHTWDGGSIESEPTCYKLGVKKYTCTDNCGATKEENYGELKDHTYGDWTPNNDGTHSRTCQVAECGHVDGPYSCSYNGIVQIVGDKEHHKEVCTVCEYDHLLDHNWGTGVETKAPSCAEGERTYTCDCNEQKTEAIPATGEHDYNGADWVSAGDYKHIMECNNCEEHKEEVHTLTNPVDNGDDHVGTCSVCGETDAHEAHKWDNGTVTDEPSCFEKGTKTYTCTVNCGATKEEDIDPTGNHTYGDWVKVDDNTHSHTCTTPGCGETEPAAHNWDNGSVTDEPSCFEKGTMTYTCTDNCGATKEEDIDPTGNHTYGNWTNNEAEGNHVHTCTTPGCGANEPAAHNWDNGTVTDEPSCFENGTKTYTCTDGCGATKEEDIDPTGAHVWGTWADNGDNHVRYCTTVGCGEPNYADHDWSNNCDTLCDTCGHTRTVVHIYGRVSTADEHWNACGICGAIEDGSRAPHNIVNGECVDCGYKTSRPMSGFFYVNDDYHMMVLTDGVITGHHTLDINGDCTICGAHISDVVEDEIVIEAPVESDTEETETEPVVNPTTGLAFALITVAAAAAVAVASKKH